MVRAFLSFSSEDSFRRRLSASSTAWTIDWFFRSLDKFSIMRSFVEVSAAKGWLQWPCLRFRGNWFGTCQSLCAASWCWVASGRARSASWIGLRKFSGNRADRASLGPAGRALFPAAGTSLLSIPWITATRSSSPSSLLTNFEAQCWFRQ